MSYLRKGFLKAAHRPNRLHCRIDSIPFVGFAFFLLCAFMTSEPMISRAVYIDLFASSYAHPVPAVTKWDAIRISVTRDGSVYFRHTKVLVDELPNRIRDATLNGAEKKIYLEVDVRAKYGDVKVVLSQIQLTGIEKVCFLTY
ncbi:MAG: biopolymer transporter ExbD [Candidatus Acidiferrum sp.]